jgi:hypothetical protein
MVDQCGAGDQPDDTEYSISLIPCSYLNDFLFWAIKMRRAETFLWAVRCSIRRSVGTLSELPWVLTTCIENNDRCNRSFVRKSLKARPGTTQEYARSIVYFDSESMECSFRLKLLPFLLHGTKPVFQQRYEALWFNVSLRLDCDALSPFSVLWIRNKACRIYVAETEKDRMASLSLTF